MRLFGALLSIFLMALVSCQKPERPLESWIPRDSLAIAWVEKPDLLKLTGLIPDAPWSELDSTRPWAAVVVPSGPPGFRLYVALKVGETAKKSVIQWARSRGGLEMAVKDGYAVLSTPGLPPVSVPSADQRWDFGHWGDHRDPLMVYLPLSRLATDSQLPPGIVSFLAPWRSIAAKTQGLRIGFSADGDGLRVRTTVEGLGPTGKTPDLAPFFSKPALDGWVPELPARDGAGVAWNWTPGLIHFVSQYFVESGLKERWLGIARLLGDHAWVVLAPDGQTWFGAVDMADPQGFRQALKALVASGDLVRQFPRWALDLDTAVIVQDRRQNSGDVVTRIQASDQTWWLAYGDHQVFWSTSLSGLALAKARTPNATIADADTQAVAAWSWQGLRARTEVTVDSEGTAELQLKIAPEDLPTWRDRLPQALLSWLTGEGGWTLWEP